MWVPASVVFVAAGLFYFALWMKESERRTLRSSVSFLALVALAGATLILSGCERSVSRDAAELTGGDPQRGRAIIAKYGCDTCHTIPGVRTANARVGPPLDGVATACTSADTCRTRPATCRTSSAIRIGTIR